MAKFPNTYISVIGMSCRFPSAANIKEYHKLLKDGKSVFVEIATEDSLNASVPKEIAESSGFVNKAAVLDNIFKFDKEKFQLTDQELKKIDPQQYHFLECCWEGLFEANCLEGNKNVGVFAGTDTSLLSKHKIDESTLWDPMNNWNDILLNDSHFLTTWTSYRLNLIGPSVGIQTACSTSLVAIHMACNALLAGECDIAIAGGVSIRGPQVKGYMYRDGGILSPSGNCKPFSSESDGTVLSSGVGIVVLQLANNAVTDNRKIWANIIGSAINNDGNLKAAYTAPNGNSQEKLISETLALAGVEPKDIGYVEAHGTGTKLGDAIEFNSLNRIFQNTNNNHYIGTCKSVFGHLESAAGVAGFIKSVLSVHFNEIYPLVGFNKPNDELNLQKTKLKFPQKIEKYDENNNLRRAGISSFGIGGTNAHVVIEENSIKENKANYDYLSSISYNRISVVQDTNIKIAKNKTSDSEDESIGTYIKKQWETFANYTPKSNDDFFDNGGDSLVAMQLVSRINNKYEINLNINDFYQNSIFRNLIFFVEEKIKLTNDRPYLLSPNQQSLYILNELNPKAFNYNVYSCFKVNGYLDIHALKTAFKYLINKHEVFRTSFYQYEDTFYQKVIHHSVKVPFNEVEIENLTEIDTKIQNHISQVFNLLETPLISFLLIKAGNSIYYISVVTHHIISDEWSANIIMKDIMDYYETVSRNKDYIPNNESKPFRQIAENQYLNSFQYETKTKLAFWKNYLKNIKPLKLGYNYKDNNFEGDREYFRIDKELVKRAKIVVKEYRTTPFSVFFSLFQILVYRYSGMLNSTIGINTSGRKNMDEEEVVGYFTNTLPYAYKLSREHSFPELVKNTQKSINELLSNQLPLSLISNEIGKESSHLNVLFAFQNVPKTDIKLRDAKIEILNKHNGTSKFDIEFVLNENREEYIDGYIEYSSRNHASSFILGLINHFKNLISEIDNLKACNVADIKIIKGDEKKKITDYFNRHTSDDYIKRNNIFDEFSNYVKNNPNKPAVILPDNKSISYHELWDRSIAIHLLIKRYLEDREGEIIAIFCERSEKFLASVLAVQFSGNTFLPIDPQIPDVRVNDILSDSKVKLVITSDALVSRVEKIIHSVDSEIKALNYNSTKVNYKGNNIKIKNPDEAYVMYTSGTTGKPKGAVVTQVGMINHLHEKIRTVRLNDSTVFAQTASLSFDISIWQFLAPILSGGTIVVFSDEQVYDIDKFITRIEHQNCTVVELVPSYLEILIQGVTEKNFKNLNILLSTGEALTKNIADKWFSKFPNIPIINAYGPTECADDVLQYEFNNESLLSDIVPIGFPLANVKIYILDHDMEPVPIGVVGKIYVGGIAVGNGYLNNEEQTEKAFIIDKDINKDGVLYNTGDLGVWRNDGSVLYFGREDNQIKLNGARIELSEIDSKLNDCPGVKQAVTVFDIDQNILIAFLVPSNSILTIGDCRTYCSSELPRFMQPSKFVIIDEIPRTNSGKIDRNNLLKSVKNSEKYKNTENQGENNDSVYTHIHRAWKEVLGVDIIKDYDNFFDLGGTSLSAMRLVAILKRKGVNLEVNDIYKTPVLSGLVQGISTLNNTYSFNRSDLTKGESWFFKEMFDSYNINDNAYIVQVEHTTSKNQVKEAIKKIWENNKNLRAKYNLNKESWEKYFFKKNELPIYEYALSKDTTDKQLSSFIYTIRDKYFEQDTPLFDAAIVDVEDKYKLILIRAHYLVCDFVSWNLIFDQFSALIQPLKKNATRIFKLNGRINSLNKILTIDKNTTLKLSELSQKLYVPMEIIILFLFEEILLKINTNKQLKILVGKSGRSESNSCHSIITEVGRYTYPIVNIPPKTKNINIFDRLKALNTEINSVQKDFQEIDEFSFDAAFDYLGKLDIKSYGYAINPIQRNVKEQKKKLAAPLELITWEEKENIYLEYRCLDNHLINDISMSGISDIINKIFKTNA